MVYEDIVALQMKKADELEVAINRKDKAKVEKLFDWYISAGADRGDLPDRVIARFEQLGKKAAKVWPKG